MNYDDFDDYNPRDYRRQEDDEDEDELEEEEEEETGQDVVAVQLSEETYAEYLHSNLESFDEKKFVKTKGELFQKLNDLLSKHFFPVQVLKIQESLLFNVNRSIRGSKTESEFIEGLRALSLFLFINCDEFDNSPLFSEYFSLLAPIAKDVSKSPSIRAATLEAIAVLCFICTTEIENTRQTIEVFRTVFQSKPQKPPPHVISTSLSCLSLVLTSIELRHLRQDYLFPSTNNSKDKDMSSPLSLSVSILKNLLFLLEHTELSVRMNAGEALALIFSLDLPTAAETWSKRYCSSMNPDKLQHEIDSLSKERNRHQAKKDQYTQRRAFKNISLSILDGQAPEEILIVRGQRVRLNDWSNIIRAHFIRKVFRSGFPIHLLNNESLQEMVDVNLDKNYDPANISSQEKRMMMSQNSEFARERTKLRKKQRNVRQKQTNLFQGED